METSASLDFVYREALRWGIGPGALLKTWRAWRSFARDRAWADAAAAAAMRVAEAGTHAAVVSCGPPHMAHLAARDVAGRLGVPFVMDLRDPWALAPAVEASLASPLWYRLAERCEAAAVDAAALVVANTPALRDALRTAHPAAAVRVIAILNGCDEEPVPPPVRDGVFRVTYAGNLYIDRDPRPFFRAAARVAREAGAGPERFAIELVGHVDAFGGRSVRDLAEREGLLEHLIVLPRVPRGEALRILARASVLLSLPQDVDLAIPSKLFEYMQFPAWVLALAREGSATELLLRGSGADVVDPGDEDGIAAALRDRFRRWASGEIAAPLNADGRFGRRRQARMLLDALDQVTGMTTVPEREPGWAA